MTKGKQLILFESWNLPGFISDYYFEKFQERPENGRGSLFDVELFVKESPDHDGVPQEIYDWFMTELSEEERKLPIYVRVDW